ncbi:MAG: alkaline phosphatase family protein [Microbacteriaceae bacterium]|nr:alkaline phosphatase family protein [Microbacteriaceae bacterium]
MTLEVPKNAGRQLAKLMPAALNQLLAGKVRAAVVIVVDGLGWVNLKANQQIAQTLLGMRAKRLVTVAPSTTAAALTTLTTGTLPGQHGLIGYKILNPRTDNLTVTLSDWDEISDVRGWQTQATVFERATLQGIPARVFARPAHAESGLTRAILTGAEYVAGQTMGQRFAALNDLLRRSESGIFYLYIDELDRAGHHSGCGSLKWRNLLGGLDTHISDLLRGLPADVGVFLTADHGIIDFNRQQQVILEERFSLPAGTRFGGEPRFRSLYLPDPEQAESLLAEMRRVAGGSVQVGTRAAWIESGLFGPVSPQIAARLGDIIAVPRKRLTLYSETDPAASFQMVGQHGGLDEDEMGIPLLTAGAFTPELL